MTPMTRDQYVEWCKKRALDQIGQGQPENVLVSMASDLNNRPDTANHPAIALGMRLLLGGHLDGDPAMRRFIEGFH
jgi:hypothetical protein